MRGAPMTVRLADLPSVRGKLIENAPLAPYTWFRAGGPADVLFLPVDEDDLVEFLMDLDPAVPVTVLGVGSNVIIRDGGIEGVVIRLMGKSWGSVMPAGDIKLRAGAGALDVSVARAAARAGITGLEFLSGIPGSLGGAMRTNAGCYGRELKDVLLQAYGVTRTGEQVTYQGQIEDFDLPQLALDYRHTDVPDDVIITEVLLQGTGQDDPPLISAAIDALQEQRQASQPIRDKTSGSTFANPDAPGTPNQRSAWRLIDAAGCRGLELGGARVSNLHCNFLINAGTATAADLEKLGELVRKRVKAHSGVELRWEVRRIGRPA